MGQSIIYSINDQTIFKNTLNFDREILYINHESSTKLCREHTSVAHARQGAVLMFDKSTFKADATPLEMLKHKNISWSEFGKLVLKECIRLDKVKKNK